MPYEKPLIYTSANPYKKMDNKVNVTRTIYYGEVISIDDTTDGGRITVRISDLDNKVSNDNLPDCYPLLPKFFHINPKVGEVVRIFIEDPKYPNRSRFYTGSVISQLQKINFDSIYTALSTTNIPLIKPLQAISTIPTAKGVFPEQEDIALIGRVNTDVILKENAVNIRAGKHNNGDILTLNTTNPAQISLNFEPKSGTTSNYYSNSILFGDKIALISHTGNPKFKAANLTADDRTKIFDDAHPMARADVLVEALKIMKDAIINHIHPYSGVGADKSAIINSLEAINFDNIMQKNIVIN